MTLKKGDPIPNDNHLIRHVSPGRLRKDEQMNVVGILPQAFKMGNTHSYLSANWLEFFPGGFKQQVISAVQEIRESVVVRDGSGFAIGKVEDIKTLCQTRKHRIYITLYPTQKSKSHVAIKSYPKEDDELFELLAAEEKAWGHWVLNSFVSI